MARLPQPGPEGMVEEAPGGVAGEIPRLVHDDVLIGFRQHLDFPRHLLFRQVARLEEDGIAGGHQPRGGGARPVHKEVADGDLLQPLVAVQIVVAAGQVVDQRHRRGDLGRDGDLHRAFHWNEWQFQHGR